MAREELEQSEVEDLRDAEEEILEAADDDEEQEEELVEFQASGEDSSVADPIDTGSSRRKADKSNAMPMPKLGKTGVIQNVVDMFAKMTPGQASKAYKGLMDSTGNMSSIKAKGDAKSPVKLHTMANIKVKEDLEALFADKETLTEEFFDQASTIFEAALNAKATIVEEALREDYDKKLTEAKEAYEQELESKLDEYLEYVAETWMKENEIAIESALKVEMAENFMNGVKDLFKESYVEIPEDKIDHVSNMESELTEVKKKLDEAVNDQIELKKTIKDQNASILFNEKSKGMTLKQTDEFKDLVEGLDYDSIDDFGSKLDTILETYFNKKPAATETEINEELVEVETEDKPTGLSDGPMAAYAQAISRTLRT